MINLEQFQAHLASSLETARQMGVNIRGEGDLLACFDQMNLSEGSLTALLMFVETVANFCMKHRLTVSFEVVPDGRNNKVNLKFKPTKNE